MKINSNLEIYNEDCLVILEQLISKNIKVDLVLTDPPYGATAEQWDNIINFDLLWNKLNKIVKSNGVIAIFGIEPFSTKLKSSNLKNFKYDWIWIKNQATNFLHAKNQPLRKTENIHIFYKGKGTYNPQKSEGHAPTNSSKGSTNGSLYYGDKKRDYVGGSTSRYPTNILFYNVVNNYKKLHPTQKPIDLLEYLINTYSNQNEIVLDFTSGSFSTAIAAIKTGRKFIGMEKDIDYFNIGSSRINHFLKYWSDDFKIIKE